MRYEPPLAKVIRIERDGDVVVTVIEQKRPPPDPLAPGALYERENSTAEVFQLHKLIRRDGERLTFETYDTSGTLPEPGEEFEFRPWWLSHAMEALLDPEAGWERAQFTGDDDDDLCLFTWEKMIEHPDGYHSKYGWVTADAYNAYIRDDKLRMRSAAERKSAE
ncbi:MAG TPA: hypothetical protein VD962_00470 [Rubricoccaceae bacterium]|nr:hypothetical protein [Rubricoccaceae bacterium]